MDQNGSTFNTKTFTTTAEAAAHFAGPFITNVQKGTEDSYTYTVYKGQDWENAYGMTGQVWAHGGPVVGYNLTKKVYEAHTDCSGFVSRVLAAVVPSGSSSSLYTQLATGPDGKVASFHTPQHPQPFPSAENFTDWITNGQKKNIKPVAYSQTDATPATYGHVSNAQPGDILAYQLGDGSKDTGHVMIIQSVHQLQQGKVEDQYWPSDLKEFTKSGLQFFAVQVYDCSGDPHYKGFRCYPDNKNGGVGHGTVLVIADASGAPVGFLLNYKWKVLSTEDVGFEGSDKGQLVRLAIGRAA